MERREISKNESEIKPKFITSWKLTPIKIRFGISMLKYIIQKKKYPLFLLKSLNMIRRRKVLATTKVVKFAHHYYTAIMRIPHWPSSAFDQMVANGGLNLSVSGTALKSQIDSVILGITRKCSYKCKHCYEYYNRAEEDLVSVECLKNVIRELQKIGVSIIILSGGEPMLRYEDLLELVESGDKSLSDFHIHTSGNRVTQEKALQLKNAGLTAAAIGLDDFNPIRHDNFRGYPGAYKEATQSLEHFRNAQIFTYTNMCLQKELVHSGNLWNYFKTIKDLQVGAVVLLEPKPCGGYLSKNADHLFSEQDRNTVTEFFKTANQKKEYKDYPLVSYMAYFESAQRFGCLMGGLSHFNINSLGDVQPCVFLPVSFGNILEEDFLNIYHRMRRAIPHPLRKQCPSVYLAKTIRAKKNQGIALPIPYSEIEPEWNQMFESSLESN